MGFTISEQNNSPKEDSIENHSEPYDISGIDINQLSENEKNELRSILKEEFKKE